MEHFETNVISHVLETLVFLLDLINLHHLKMIIIIQSLELLPSHPREMTMVKLTLKQNWTQFCHLYSKEKVT